jgi:hypothetical protein
MPVETSKKSFLKKRFIKFPTSGNFEISVDSYILKNKNIHRAVLLSRGFFSKNIKAKILCSSHGVILRNRVTAQFVINLGIEDGERSASSCGRFTPGQ